MFEWTVQEGLKNSACGRRNKLFMRMADLPSGMQAGALITELKQPHE